jgi:hypothetical protein
MNNQIITSAGKGYASFPQGKMDPKFISETTANLGLKLNTADFINTKDLDAYLDVGPPQMQL